MPTSKQQQKTQKSYGESGGRRGPYALVRVAKEEKEVAEVDADVLAAFRLDAEMAAI